MRVLAILAALSAAAVSACCSGTRPAESVPTNHAPPPPYASLASRYNERCARLEKLKAPVTLVIDAPDDKGGRRKDQVEAYLQFVAPSKVSLRVDKVGQTLAVLGSDDTRFWWIDLSEKPVAYVGTHARATPQAAAEFGIPIHPLDLADVLAISPLPMEDRKVGRMADGTLMIEMASRAPGWGPRRVYIDEPTALPAKVEVRDAGGGLALRAVLSRFVQVEVEDDHFAPARCASRVEIFLVREDTRITLSVASPENPSAMKPKPFDFEALVGAYGVDRTVDLDREETR